MSDIFAVPVLAIDLGASFTKVSYRLPRTAPDYREASKIVLLENQALIPSLVIHRDSDRKRWLCGWEAAEYHPSSADRVFNNWKARVFSETLDSEVAGHLGAAGEFFKWLRREIQNTGIDVSRCRVKLCLPAFDEVDRPASILGQEMEHAGWMNVSLSKVAEPRANMVGVFSEGRNCLYGTEPFYMSMYPLGSPLLEHLRGFTLRDGPRHVIMAIVDVGSFTTDVSVVDVDATGDGDFIAQTTQKSSKVGIIAGFEEPLIAELARRHGFDPVELTFEDRELIKRALASNQPYVHTFSGSRNVTFGQAFDRTIVRGVADEFAANVKTVYEKVAAPFEPRYVILTGGGCDAVAIRKAIHRYLESPDVRLLPVEGIESPSEIPARGQIQRYVDTGESLGRLATALGAASVILDLPLKPPLPEGAEPKRVESPWVACSCQGGNKDCVRCGGRGEYLRARF